VRISRRMALSISIPLVAAAFTIGVRMAASRPLERPPTLACLEHIDLGERERGEIVECFFHIGNAGHRPLKLAEFHTSCSCAGVERVVDGRFVSVGSIELQPDEETQLVARVSIGAQYGESQSVQVFFKTNDPTRPVHLIQVLVPRVRGGVYAHPKAIIFGAIPVGAQPKTTIEPYDCGVRGRKVATVSSTHPKQFSARLLPLDEYEVPKSHPTAGRMIGRLEVTVLAGQRGPLDGDVEVQVANEKRPPDRIRVLGDTVGVLDCWPRQLIVSRNFGETRDLVGEVLLMSRDGKPIEVVVESVPSGMTAVVRIAPQRMDAATVVVKRTSDAARGSGPTTHSRVTLRILHDGKEIKEDVAITTWEGPS